MKFPLIKTTGFFLIILFFSLSVSAKKFISDYKIEVGGINIGTVHWIINKGEKKYKTVIQLRNGGLLLALYNFSGNYSSEGIIIDNYLVSSNYYQLWKTKKKTRKVEIQFKNKMVSMLDLKPKELEVPRVNYLNSKDLTDPLSSFINIIINGNNRLQTIDGRRLYKMVLDKETIKNNTVVKKIIIKDYFNIWTDHKRNDLKSIELELALPDENIFFPKKIKIKHKSLVFKLTKI